MASFASLRLTRPTELAWHRESESASRRSTTWSSTRPPRISRTAEKTGAQVSGPIPLPVKMERWTVLRSPHIDKKSREQFELRTHKRLLDINDSRPQTMDALTKLDLPAGVDVEIKVE